MLATRGKASGLGVLHSCTEISNICYVYSLIYWNFYGTIRSRVLLALDRFFINMFIIKIHSSDFLKLCTSFKH